VDGWRTEGLKHELTEYISTEGRVYVDQKRDGEINCRSKRLFISIHE
jgi:hypothetical protein